MEQLLGNDEKIDAERAYNSLQVQKKILFFLFPSQCFRLIAAPSIVINLLAERTYNLLACNF
jgi:hypothetical protein